MKKQIEWSSLNWGKGFSAALLLLLACVLAPATAANASAHLQPLLSQYAVSSPEMQVGVIVQKTTATANVEAAVARLGGTLDKNLPLINGFAARILAKDAPLLAQVEGVKYVSLDAPMYTSGGPTKTKFTIWTTKIGAAVANGFANSANILSPVGINKTYGAGANVKGAFGGFNPEYTPGVGIVKVEVALRMYVAASLASSETPKFTPYVEGAAGSAVIAPVAIFNAHVGVNAVGTEYVDITNARAWTWQDFAAAKNLEILVDQSLVAKTHTIYYDAIGLRITTDVSKADTTTSLAMTSSLDGGAVDTSVLANVYNKAVRATDVWNEAPYRKGANITVAVVDSGNFKSNAIGARLIGEVNFNSAEHLANDQYGHGTFVTGLIADDGTYSANKYMGVAPAANILGVRVSDDNGAALESDVVNALQWIYNNKATYNIKVVNISMNSSVYHSYHTSPIDAAVEILWFNKIVVVVSAGNNGTNTLYPPANDPFVITVGAADDMATVALTDDAVAAFSAYGLDEEGGVKPDLVAPGKNLIAYLPDTTKLTISTLHPENRVDANYFRMSGTSMSAPLVAGAAAILIEANPSFTPDQIKYRLKATANKSWAGYLASKAGAGYLDVYAAVKGTTTASANTGLTASNLLFTGLNRPAWSSVDWGSVDWGSVDWGSVDWGSVDWGSVDWGSDKWGP